MAHEHYTWQEYEAMWHKANPTRNVLTRVWIEHLPSTRDRGWVAWHAPATINLVPSRCTPLGRGYGWPGASADCTVSGVWAHELGHTVHMQEEEFGVGICWELRRIREPRVSSYEPNDSETFAETMRLFVCNPKLLSIGRPQRYDYLIRLGLKPVRKLRTWEHGLAKGYGRRHFDLCERWIARLQH